MKIYFKVMYADEFNTPTVELDELKTYEEALEVLRDFESINDLDCWIEEYDEDLCLQS